VPEEAASWTGSLQALSRVDRPAQWVCPSYEVYPQQGSPESTPKRGNILNRLAMHYLALALWPMGDIGRGVSLIGRAEARIADLTHVGTLAPGRMHAAVFGLMRGDRTRVAPNAFELTRLGREFDLNLFRAFGAFLEGWASAASGARGRGLEGMRRGVELLREQNVLCFDGLLKMALAEAESQGADPGRAVAMTGSRGMELGPRLGPIGRQPSFVFIYQ